MRFPRAILGSIVGFAAFLLGTTAAWAPGSIPLSEVMEQLKDTTKLIDELKAELAAQNLDPENVVCVGMRFGRHWAHLGGARAIPYDCTLGKREIHIDGELHLYDKSGNELDIDAADTPDRAVDYKQTNLKWAWK